MALDTHLELVRRVGLTALEQAGRHPRRISAVVTALLGGFAAAAFSIAPLAPDAALLPQQLVVEALQPTDLPAQADALAGRELHLWRTEVTRSADTMAALLTRLGVNDPTVVAFIRSDKDARRLIEGRGGKLVQARTAANGSLLELVARFPALDTTQSSTHFTRLTLSKTQGSWQSRLETAALQTRTRLGSGTIRSSLFAAIDESGLPDAVATQMAEMFATDIDFHRELRKGATFSVAYEALYADDQPVPWNEGAGRVLAAEFVNKGRAHQALWFATASGKGAYFGFDGRSKRRAFLASPMEFSRVTSGFAMRLHPLSRQWRRHLGVDYGAPTGTPVLTVGDGTVEFAGQQRGYGNVISIRHGKDRNTLYAHLSRIDVKLGQRVEQGQRIGAVGATGYATGPHLHFEFRVDGEHHDPLEIARAAETQTLDAAARPQFDRMSHALQAQLQVAAAAGFVRGAGE